MIRRSSRRIRRVALPLLVIVACAACGPHELIKKPVSNGSPQPPTPARVLSATTVTLDLRPLRTVNQMKVTVSIPGGPKLDIDRLRIAGSQSANFVWIGRVRKHPLSLATFAVTNDLVEGTIDLGTGELYELRYIAPGVHVLRAIDASSFPREADPLPAPAALAADAAPPCIEREPRVIDVDVHYTATERTAYGGAAAIEALADQAIQASNQTYLDSGIDLNLRLAGISEVAYDDVAGVASQTALTALQTTADGQMDDVHAQRETNHADVVVLFANITDACGIAYLLTTTAPRPQAAFAVVDPGCAVGNFSFAHEIGHVLAARHDRYIDNTDGPYTYSHGWIDTTAHTRSVMAYNDQCLAAGYSCARLGRWSNPDQSFGATNADNRQTLNNTGPIISTYRCRDPDSSGGTPDAAIVSTSLRDTDGNGNFWYLDRRDQPVTIEVKNTGTSTWDSTYAIALVEPADNTNQNGGQLLDITRVALAPGEHVAPGNSKLFQFSFVGNGRALAFQWQMQRGTGSGSWFGERTASVVLQPKGF